MADKTVGVPGSGEPVNGQHHLTGLRVLVTRAREQAEAFSEALAARGALPIELPTIRFDPPDDWAPVDAAIDALAEYDWVIFTSVNGVRFFTERLRQLGRGPEALRAVHLGAIGPATARALDGYDLTVAFVPTTYVAEAIVEELGRIELSGRRVLLPRAREAREVLARGLQDRGARVDEVAVYQTRPDGDPAAAQRLFEDQQIDVVTFTSSSTVRHLCQLLGDRAPEMLRGAIVASIGPVTSQTARELGLAIQVEAEEHTMPGLVAAIEQFFLAPVGAPR